MAVLLLLCSLQRQVLAAQERFLPGESLMRNVCSGWDGQMQRLSTEETV